MRRTTWFLLIMVFSLCTLVVSVAWAGQSKSRQPPEALGFYGSSDPAEAKRRVLEEAQKLGVDLNHRRGRYGIHAIGLPNMEWFTPSPDPSPLVSKIAEMDTSELVGDTLAIVSVFQVFSAQDLVDLFNLDITIYVTLGAYGFLVRTPLSSIVALYEHENVRWVGVFKDSYKYKPTDTSHGRGFVYAHSLVGDQPSCRDELAALGYVVTSYRDLGNDHFYTMKNTGVPLDKVAELPWVWKVWLEVSVEER